MAKKQATKKHVAAKLPAGFSAIAVGGGFGAWWDFTKQKVLQGKVIGIDSYMAGEGKKKKKRRILRVKDSKGVVVNVGESFALKELFDTPKIVGKEIYLRWDGQDKFKKDGETRKVNKFTAGVK